jgi:serine/threonine protein kinase
MVGRTISHYQILSQIGEGGMGVVYKAQDTKLNRPVALKFLSAQYVNEADKARFLREAQAAALLNHPNICPIFDIDEVDGQIFFAMAFLDGRTLSKVIAAERIELDRAIDITKQIAAGLEEAHEHGVVHRDIKANNIMVNDRGHATLLDFGVALVGDRSRLTNKEHTIGTAAYMSPEQAQGKPVDHRTDVWSLGVVFFELLAGRLPFTGDRYVAVMYSIVNE